MPQRALAHPVRSRRLAPAVGTLVLAAGAWLSCSAPSPSSQTEDPSAVLPRSSFEQQGLRVEMELARLGDAVDGVAEVVEGENVDLLFHVSEAVDDGKPIAGLSPLAWLSRRDEGTPQPDEKGCEFQIRGLLAGRLARSADVNLNEYLLVTLDDNNSVSIIDPQIESSKTKTLGMITLTSKGRDFVLAPDRHNVLVTLPSQGRVAAADMFTRKARYIDVGGEPHCVVVQPDGVYAWVGDAGSGPVSAIDIRAFERSGTVDAGPGPHVIAFRDDSAVAYVSSPRQVDLVVVDTRSFDTLARVPVGSGAVGAVSSERTGKVYVARASGAIEIVDGKTFERAGSVSLPPGLTGFWVSPSGLLGFALHRDDAQLSIVDLPTQRVLHRLPTRPQPDLVTFTETFAYIRHAASGEMLLVDLSLLARGDVPVLAPIPMGQRPPATDGSGVIAPVVAPLPEGGGALVLNPADRSIYHFMEGMSAPMGSYQTYPWTATGLLVSDRTIREVEKGVYRTEFKLPRAGTYTAAFLVPTSPQIYGCMTVEVSPRAGVARERLAFRLETVEPGTVASIGAPQTLLVEVRDPESGAPVDGIDDLMVLVMRGPVWQWRGAARAAGDGRYAVDLTLPQAGIYQVMVASDARGVTFGQGRSTVLHVEPDGGASAGAEETSG